MNQFGAVQTVGRRMVLLPLLAFFSISAQPIAPRIAGTVVVPHVYSDELRYGPNGLPERGALVHLVLENPDPARPARFAPRIENRTDAENILAGEWTWGETRRLIAPGAIGVATFNGRTERWGAGRVISLDGYSPLRLDSADVLLTKIAFTGGRAWGHLQNRSAQPVRVLSARWLVGDARGNYRPEAGSPALSCFDPECTIAAGDWSGFHLAPPAARRGPVILEVRLDGRAPLWGVVKVKDDSFDIGAGWLNVPAPNGRNPLTVPEFRKTLRRLWVNAARVDFDPPGEHPLRLIGGRGALEKYDTPEWRDRIHTIEALGEVQMGPEHPADVFRQMRRFAASPFPSSITFSEEPGFRFYAGLCDYPHFDAYRVNAPMADRWRDYDRWGGARIGWGAPLEGVGTMMRTLKAVNYPRPAAAWSQNVHYNWRTGYDGRPRLQPTPDEILLQAWQVIANGAQSLYWYSLESWSLLKYRDTMQVTAQVGRTLRLLEEILAPGEAVLHQRSGSTDLNVVATADAALVVAMELGYTPDPVEKVFRFPGPRPLRAEVALPVRLRRPAECFRVESGGIAPAPCRSTPQGIRIDDTLDRVALYVVSAQPGLRERLTARLTELKKAEAAIGFDPVGNDRDFAALVAALGEPPR